MELCDLIKTFEKNTGTFPREAVMEAISRQDEIVPELLNILDETLKRTEELAKDNDGSRYYAHFYAMFLLAQFREPRAYPLVVQFARLPERILDSLAGDFITENLSRVLASVCDGEINLIKSLIEDSTVHEYARAAAVESLKIRVAQGDADRTEVMAYFKELFNGRLERTNNYVWNELVSSATRLHPREVLEDIVAAYEEGLLENFFMSVADVQKVMDMDPGKVLSRLSKSTPGYIDDVIKEMHWWHCFNQDKYSKESRIILPQEENNLPKHNLSSKTGPNDPCICGSGRKYKKCCGRVE
jgi:hypothetical protein